MHWKLEMNFGGLPWAFWHDMDHALSLLSLQQYPQIEYIYLLLVKIKGIFHLEEIRKLHESQSYQNGLQ